MNERPPAPIGDAFLEVQDAYLREEIRGRGITDASSLPSSPGYEGISLWRGDITTLQVDTIVNAANSALLGCFLPGHRCIDNAIHTWAGVQLRLECHRLMQAQGYPEPTGGVKLTPAYNLPSRYILHTVGPIVRGEVDEGDRAALRSCYLSCLRRAAAQRLRSVAFCCISTGEFHFPGHSAARIAVETISGFLREHPGTLRQVVCNVFTAEDEEIYTGLLGG